MMRTSGITGRAGLALVFVMAVAGAALAAETCVQCVPSGSSYVATAVLVPGCGGAEVCSDKGQGHIAFRIGFGVDLGLSVNGACAGAYCPQATYRVTVACQKIGGQWFATTTVVNQSTGLPVFHQPNYPMCEAADEVSAAADDVVMLSVQ